MPLRPIFCEYARLTILWLDWFWFNFATLNRVILLASTSGNPSILWLSFSEGSNSVCLSEHLVNLILISEEHWENNDRNIVPNVCGHRESVNYKMSAHYNYMMSAHYKLC